MTTKCLTVERPANAAERPRRPRVDIVEHATEYRLVAEVPGVRREDVEIGFEQGVLSIRTAAPESVERRYHVREYESTAFAREFRLGDTIDAAGISAELERGVLTVHLPKVAAVTPHRIEVR